MADEDDCSALHLGLAELSEALSLKRYVTNGEHFINDQDLWFKECSNRKSESDLHARGVPLDLGINKFSSLGELDNLIELLANFGLSHSEN